MLCTARSNDRPQADWRAVEIDLAQGWDDANGTLDLTRVRRLRFSWNHDEGAGRVAGEMIYLDAIEIVDPAF